MTDNPLAEWLRERHAALGSSAPTEPGDPTPDEDAAWPRWEVQEASPAAARWDRPPGDGGSPRRRRLVMAAVVPWLVAAGLGGAALVRGDAGDAGHAVIPEHTTTTGVVDPAPAERPTDAVPPAEVAPLDPALGAAAAIAVRLSVTTPGAGPDEGEDRRYVDLAVPETLHRYGDVAVVIVAAVILEGPADAWRTARAARFAVPVGWVDGAATALAQPWVVPAPVDAVSPAGWQPATSDPAAVTTAVQAAGYTDTEVIGAAASPDHPGLLAVEVRARAPGEAGARRHTVWLRTDPELAVLGTPADRP